MKNARSYITLIILGFILLLGVLYIFLFRAYVSLAYEGNAPGWFQQLIDFLYPRFQVEKQRFELSFFLYKADQILIRCFLVGLGISLFLRFKSPKTLLKENVKLHSKRFYTLLIRLFYAGLLYYTWQWVYEFEQIVRIHAFYQPVLLFRILHLPIPPLTLFHGFYVLYILSIILILCRYREVWFSCLAVVLLLFFQGYSFSFEKIEHGQTTLTYAAMLMPALLYEIKRQDHTKNSAYDLQSSWVLFLIQLSIAGVYFLAGLEKLLSSGLDWATAETFRSYITLHQQPMGLKVAANDFLVHVLPWAALLFQLGFILILFHRRLKYLFLISGIFFHLGTKLLMDIGPYFSSWIFVYLFFIDWDVLLKRRDAWMASRHKQSQKGA